jgi:hypothetical protein
MKKDEMSKKVKWENCGSEVLISWCTSRLLSLFRCGADEDRRGYHGNEEATRNTINRDGWFMTGDVCVRSSSGDYTIVDRTKELIKYVLPAVHGYR